MKQLVWMGTGVVIGVIALRKVNQAKCGPRYEGLDRAVNRFADGIHDFADAVRAGMHERDTELREALRANSAI